MIKALKEFAAPWDLTDNAMADITTGAKIVSTQVAKKHPATGPKVAEL